MLIPHCPALRSARACCGLVVVLSGRALANPEFIPLGDIPGGIFWSHAHAVSADGTAVVGFSHGGAPGQVYLGPFLWKEETGMVPLGTLDTTPPLSGGNAYAVANGGAAVTGLTPTNGANQAYIWTPEGGMVSLGGFDGPESFSNSYDITPDGLVIVGTSNGISVGVSAYRWTASGGFEVIPAFQATAVSADGSVVVGYTANPFAAFRWEEGQAFVQPLGSLPGGVESTPHDISPDGSVVVGVADTLPSFTDGGTIDQAFVWRASTGMQPLEMPIGAASSRANGVSASGVVVGSAFFADGQHAVVWKNGGAGRRLDEVLASDYGLDIGAWVLVEAADVSDDGSVIVGLGTNPQGSPEGFVVRLPVCAGDFDGDGIVGSTDLNRVLVSFGAGSGGDLDGDGDTDSADLNLVLRAFGCGELAN